MLPPGSAGNVTAPELFSLGPGKQGDDPASLLTGLADPQGFFTTATPTSPRNSGSPPTPPNSLRRSSTS